MKRLILAVLLAAAGMAAADPIWVRDGTGYSGTFRDVCMLDDSTGWAVGDEGVVYKRQGTLYPSTSQQVWFSQTIMPSSQTGWDFKGVYFDDYNNGWVVGHKNGGADKYKGVIVRMLNGVWQEPTYSHRILGLQNTPDSLTPFLKVRMVKNPINNKYYGYVSCGNGYILKWNPDQGLWVPIRPFAPEMDPTDTISTWYRDIYMDLSYPDRVWAIGDHSGVMVSSVDGGASWGAAYPGIFAQAYNWPPNTNTPLGTRVASLAMAGYGGNVFTGMGEGLTGHYSGGWGELYPLGRDNWNYGLAIGPGNEVFACGNTYRNIGALRKMRSDTVIFEKVPSWITTLSLKSLDFPENSDHGRAVGSSNILHRYAPADVTDFTVDRQGDSLWVSWTSTVENNLRKWNVGTHSVIGQDNGIITGDSLLPNGAGSTYLVKIHSWAVDTTNPNFKYERDRYITVRATCKDGTILNFGPIRATEGIDRLMPQPNAITKVEDVPGDEGFKLKLHWKPPMTYGYIMRSLTPSGPWVGCGSVWGTTCSTFISSDLPVNDMPLYFIIQNMDDLVSYSKPSNIIPGIAKDSIAPATLAAPTGWYDSLTHVITLNWGKSTAVDLGGYWVCPEPLGKFAASLPLSGIPDAYHVEHSSPIDRTIYKYRVPDNLIGQTLGFAVTAMDRSGNIGPWSPTVNINTNVKTQSTSPQATAYNNGRKLLYDQDGNLHLAYVSNDSVFYQKSWDDGYSWTPAKGAEGGGTQPLACLGLAGNEPVLSWSSVIPKRWGLSYEPAFTLRAGRMDGGNAIWRIVEQRSSAMNLRQECSPPSLAVKEGIVHLVYEVNEVYTRPAFRWAWKLKHAAFPITAIDGSQDPISAEVAILDSAGHSGIIEPRLTSPSICFDARGGIHVAWEREGEIWWRMYDPCTREWRQKANISNSPDLESLEPSLSLYGDVNLVWQEGSDIAHRRGAYSLAQEDTSKGILPQYGFKWAGVENISNNPTTPSLWPVYDGGHAAWSEEIKEGITEACCAHYSDFLWKQIPDFSKNPTQPSNYPHIAYRQNSDGNRMVTVWTEGTGPLYSLIARDTAGQVTPQFAAILGGEEPSIYTIERDGYLTFEGGISVDYDSTELQYYLPCLDAGQETSIELVFYQPNAKANIQHKVYINDIPLGVANIPAGEVYTFSKKIPPAAMKDGDGILRIENKKGVYAACAKWQLFAYDRATGRGGGKSGGQAEIGGEKPIAYRYELLQNAPNPSKQITTIRYQLAKPGKVNLKIYNTLGQVVKTIVDQDQQPGIYRVNWDGKDNQGKQVANGVYLYRLSAGSFTDTKKMVMVR